MPIIISMHYYRGGTGKSNLTANLAMSMVQQGRSVAIVDTDIQSPGIHVLFGLDQGNMGRTLEVARKLWVEQVLLVVNKVVPSQYRESLKQDVQQTYHVPVIGVLPLSEQIARMGSEGLFLLQYPEHLYSQGVQEVAAQLLSVAGDTSERKVREKGEAG